MTNTTAPDDKLTRYLLVGLMTGIFVSISNFVFDVAYCQYVGFTDFGMINIGTIFYGCVLPLTLFGLLFYYLDNLRGGIIIYLILSLVLLFALIYLVNSSEMYQDAHKQQSFRKLVTGLLLIFGAGFVIIIPLLAKNKRLTESFL